MRRWKLLWQALQALFAGAIVITSLYQIGSALVSGELLVPSRRPPRRYVDFPTHPFLFVFSLFFYGAAAVLFSVGLYLMFWGESRFNKAWRWRMAKPPLDEARREPPDRTPG